MLQNQHCGATPQPEQSFHTGKGEGEDGGDGEDGRDGEDGGEGEDEDGENLVSDLQVSVVCKFFQFC